MEVIKDERKVDIVDNHVIFELNNVQKFTKKKAKTIYDDWKAEVEKKEKYIEEFNEKKKELEQKIEEKVSQQLEHIKKMFPGTDMVKLKHWKDIQVHIAMEQQKMQLEQMKDDIKAVKATIETWKICEDIKDEE